MKIKQIISLMLENTSIFELIKNQLQKKEMSFFLDRFIQSPTDGNLAVLATILKVELEENTDFLESLQHTILSSIPLLEDAEIDGDLEIGNITIDIKDPPQGKQVFGKGMKIGGKAKFGDITIRNS